jgi:hypothetical protein
MWSIHNTVVRVTAEPKTDYDKLKKRINYATLGYGGALTSMYFITHGAEQGVSSTIGVATSFAYISLLERHVENIEKPPFQKHLLAPIGTAIFETVWNSAPFAFDFDYGATFVGFLAYKVALLNLMYDEVRKMLLLNDEEKD